MPIEGWRIHRRIGMSGGLFTRALARELGRPLEDADVAPAPARGALPRPAPRAAAAPRRGGAAGPPAFGVPYGIATSGRRPEIDASLAALGIGDDVTVVERGDVMRAKPEPDLFLACQERMGVRARDCYVVGATLWDLLAARRAGMLRWAS